MNLSAQEFGGSLVWHDWPSSAMCSGVDAATAAHQIGAAVDQLRGLHAKIGSAEAVTVRRRFTRRCGRPALGLASNGILA